MTSLYVHDNNAINIIKHFMTFRPFKIRVSENLFLVRLYIVVLIVHFLEISNKPLLVFLAWIPRTKK